jgi:hypothetical protein
LTCDGDIEIEWQTADREDLIDIDAAFTGLPVIVQQGKRPREAGKCPGELLVERVVAAEDADRQPLALQTV